MKIKPPETQTTSTLTAPIHVSNKGTNTTNDTLNKSINNSTNNSTDMITDCDETSSTSSVPYSWSKSSPTLNSSPSSSPSSSLTNLSLRPKSKMKSHPWNNVPLFLSAQTQRSSTCEHPNQCTTRQPRSPPLPSITFLINEKSKYHLHMMTRSVDEFAGCFRCFSVDNENYGCDNCTWLKWWFKWHGELHGFPDVSPWIYKKYL